MTQTLQLIVRSFSVTALNMCKGLMEKRGNMCEKIGNVSKEMEPTKRKRNRNSSTEEV